MTIDHRREFLIRLEPLPLEARAPVLEDAPCPSLALVAPQLAEPVVKLAHARLRTVLAAKPDRATAHEIADHDPVAATFADRKLVDADHLRSGRANALELRFHVLLVQNLDSLPVQRQFL